MDRLLRNSYCTLSLCYNWTYERVTNSIEKKIQPNTLLLFKNDYRSIFRLKFEMNILDSETS